MLLNWIVCSRGHSGWKRWIISSYLSPGSITDEPCLFERSSYAKYCHPFWSVQDERYCPVTVCGRSAEQLLLGSGWVRLWPESIIKTNAFSFLTSESKTCYQVVVSIATEVIWKTRMKWQVEGIFVSGPGFMNYSTFYLKRKLGLGRRCLPPETFKMRWKNIARMLVWISQHEW